jgi:DNA primase
MLREEQIAMVREAVTMRQVADMYGYRVSRSGFIKCPFHADSNPSMKIYDGSRGYFCFVCKEGGDVIHFVQKHDGLGFEDAVKKLAGMFGIFGTEISEEDKQRYVRQRAEREAVRTARERAFERLDSLSRKIHKVKYWIGKFEPLGSAWTALHKRLERLEGQWETEFEAIGELDRKGGAK